MEELTPSLADVVNLATEKVNLGRHLIGELKNLNGKIEGVQRIHKQIVQEVNFLLKATNEGLITFQQINASKLLHLECLVKILLKCRGLTSVDYVLPLEESDSDPMRVDIICENGACTVNVEAKNLQTLNNSLIESHNIGRQRILNQAEEFVEAATANPEVPKPPQVCLIFDNELDTGNSKGVDDSLMDFVNSIVKMDSNDRQWEFHLNNNGQEDTRVEDEDRSKSVREYKRVQMQQRRSNPVIRTAENDRKRSRRHEKRELDGLGPPRRYQKRTDEPIEDDGSDRDVDERPILMEHQPKDDDDVKTETSPDMYELVQGVEPDPTYAEVQGYFCETCKDTGAAYEQEILRLREELKHKDTIINSLKSALNLPSSKVIVAGLEVMEGDEGSTRN